MKKKTLFSLVFSLALASFLFIIIPHTSLAQTGNTLNTLTGLDETAGAVDAYRDQTGSRQDYGNFLQTKVGQIVGLALSFVGVIFLILMMYAGILWMTAQGNDQQVVKAKNMLINSTIGLIIVLSAYAITVFIGAEILS